MPSFFVPDVAADKQEEAYAFFAEQCHRAVPPLADRIYSITYTHNGEVWTATVGETLRGSVTRVKTVRRQRTERTIPLSNPSVVMAIFPGVPFHVWHNGASRVWANPFLTGEPLSITRFAEQAA